MPRAGAGPGATEVPRPAGPNVDPCRTGRWSLLRSVMWTEGEAGTIALELLF